MGKGRVLIPFVCVPVCISARTIKNWCS